MGIGFHKYFSKAGFSLITMLSLTKFQLRSFAGNGDQSIDYSNAKLVVEAYWSFLMTLKTINDETTHRTASRVWVLNSIDSLYRNFAQHRLQVYELSESFYNEKLKSIIVQETEFKNASGNHQRAKQANKFIRQLKVLLKNILNR